MGAPQTHEGKQASKVTIPRIHHEIILITQINFFSKHVINKGNFSLF